MAPERGSQRQEMAAISGAHALLTNIVLAWNTNRMDAVVAKLIRDGVGIEEDWSRRIGPAQLNDGHRRIRNSSSLRLRSGALLRDINPRDRPPARLYFRVSVTDSFVDAVVLLLHIQQ